MKNQDFYEALYKNATFGYDSVNELLKRTKTGALSQDMRLHRDGYRRFAKFAEDKLKDYGAPPIRAGKSKTLPARMGMAMKTMFNTTPSHIAELMMQGSGMGIVDMVRKYNRLSNDKATEEAAMVCRDVIEFEQKNIERMKPYL